MTIRSTLAATAATLAVGLLATPVASAATAQHDIARPGQRGAAVRTLQVQLQDLGYFHVLPTGYYGAVTRTAVAEYQRDAHLPVSGVDTAATAAAVTKDLRSLLANVQPLTARPGERSRTVVALQDELRYLGTFRGASTGYYGPVTVRAVRAMQREVDLPATGVIDVATGIRIVQLVNAKYTREHRP